MQRDLAPRQCARGMLASASGGQTGASSTTSALLTGASQGLAYILRTCTTQALAERGNKRASHYAAELEARAGGEAALSAAGLTPGAPLECRRLSPPLARVDSAQILLNLTRRGNEQGPLLFAAHFIACLPLVLVRLPHPRFHTLAAAGNFQRSITARVGRAKIWLACKRSSQASPAANFVQN